MREFKRVVKSWCQMQLGEDRIGLFICINPSVGGLNCAAQILEKCSKFHMQRQRVFFFFFLL